MGDHNWKPIQISRGGCKFFHLAFTDDLLLFVEASIEQATIIQSTLLNLCATSGQRVSQDKTSVFLSKNVTSLLKKDICDILGFNSTDYLGKYLGVPIFHKRACLNTFNFVLDKVLKQRLCIWKSKTLSFPGRVTLAKSGCTSYTHLCDEI